MEPGSVTTHAEVKRQLIELAVVRQAAHADGLRFERASCLQCTDCIIDITAGGEADPGLFRVPAKEIRSQERMHAHETPVVLLQHSTSSSGARGVR